MSRITLRLDNELKTLIDQYSNFVEQDISKVMRELLREGLMVKTEAKLFSMFQEKIKNRPLKLDKCDKCGAVDHLQFFHIDGNISNFNSENIAIICDTDLHNLKKSMMRFNPREKFLRWYFFEDKK